MRACSFAAVMLMGSVPQAVAADLTSIHRAAWSAPAEISESPRLLKTIQGPKDHFPSQMLYMPDGKQIVTLYNLGENGRRAKVEFRNATSGEVRLTFDVDVESSFGLTVTPDGSTLVTTNSHDLDPDVSGTGKREITGRIDLSDARTGKLKVSLVQDGYWGFSFPFIYPDGVTLAVAESRRTDDPRQRYETRLGVWDLARGASKFAIPAGRGSFYAALSRDGKLLVTGESEVEFWNPSTGEHLEAWPKLSDEKQVIRSFFSPSARRLFSLVALPHEVWSWDVSKGEVLKKAKLGSDKVLLWHMVVAPSGKFLAVSRNPQPELDSDASRAVKPEIVILDAETMTTLETLSGHRGRIYTLAISPDSARLASCGSDGTIRFWDVSRVKTDK